jgi:hypothetical protein
MYRSVLDIIAESIKNVLLIGSQKKAFKEIAQVFNEISISESTENQKKKETEFYVEL